MHTAEISSLCNALVLYARRLATQFVDPLALEAYLGSPLAPLDKNQG